MSVTLTGLLFCKAAPPGGGGDTSQTYVIGEIPGGTGTSFSLALFPICDQAVVPYLNGLALEQVAASPDTTQYTIDGDQITTGKSIVAGDHFLFDYTAIAAGVYHEALTTTGTAHTLQFTPSDPDDVLIITNGLLLERVVASPGSMEYILSGTTLTTGRSIVAADSLLAVYELPAAAAGDTTVLSEIISSTGTSHALSVAPASVGDVGLFINGTRLERVTTPASNTEYSITGGGAITTFRSVTSDDHFIASYLS